MRKWFGLNAQSAYVRVRIPIMDCRIEHMKSYLRITTNDPIMLESCWEWRELKTTTTVVKKRRGSTRKSIEALVYELAMSGACLNMKTFRVDAYVDPTKSKEELIFISDATMCLHVRESGNDSSTSKNKKRSVPCHHNPFSSFGQSNIEPQSSFRISVNSLKLDLSQSPHVVNDVVIPILSKITSEDSAQDAIRGLANLILLGRVPKGGFFQRMGGFANSVLEVMRRCHVRADATASQLCIEIPATISPGKLNEDQHEHVKNLYSVCW